MLLFRQTLHHRCNLEPSQIRRRTQPQISVSLCLGTAGLRFEHTGGPSQQSELLSERCDISFVIGGDLCATGVTGGFGSLENRAVFLRLGRISFSRGIHDNMSGLFLLRSFQGIRLPVQI